MKNYLLTVVVLLLTVTAVNAQNIGTRIITLKGGMEIQGTIVEEIPGESVTIKTEEGDLFVYRTNEISKIENPNAAAEKKLNKELEKEAKIAEQNAAKQAKIDQRLQRRQLRADRGLGNFKGYRGIIDLGGAYYDNTNLSATFINGVNLGPHFYMGVGVGINSVVVDGGGINNMDIPSYNIVSVPIFLNLRFAFARNTRVTPYLSLSGGYSLGLTDALCIEEKYNSWADCYYNACYYTSSSSLYAEPSFGLEIRLKKKTAFFFAFSVPMFVYSDEVLYYKLHMSFGGKIGFSF